VTAVARRTEEELAALLGRDQVLPGTTREFLHDASAERGVVGWADAIVLPRSADETAIAWCYERDVPVVPRGGGTGLAGGAVPQGGVVLSTDRLQALRSVDPLFWRIEVEAGVRTANLRRRAPAPPSSRTSAGTSPRTPAGRANTRARLAALED
jgi:FAD/FMN-containing dehydrogenase